MTYLNIENKSIQYEKDNEELVEIDYTEEEIEALSLDEVRDIIKNRVEEATDFRFLYQ